MAGLCARYLSNGEVNAECTGIKIFGENGRFMQVETLQCQVIYDYEVPEESSEQVSNRRCGVRFKITTSRQKSMLQDFIGHFASR